MTWSHFLKCMNLPKVGFCLWWLLQISILREQNNDICMLHFLPNYDNKECLKWSLVHRPNSNSIKNDISWTSRFEFQNKFCILSLVLEVRFNLAFSKKIWMLTVKNFVGAIYWWVFKLTLNSSRWANLKKCLLGMSFRSESRNLKFIKLTFEC